MSVARRVRGGKVSKAYWMNFQVGGKRVYQSTGKTTREEAEAVEAEARAAMEKKWVNKPLLSITLSQAIERGIEERWSKQRDPAVQLRLAKILEIMGDCKLQDIDLPWISALKQKLVVAGKAPATINRYLAHLRTVLFLARDEWGVLERVPKIKLSQTKNGRTRVITREEETIITGILRDAPHAGDTPQARGRRRSYPDIADLIEVLVDTGMRLGEALAMEYSRNIKLDENIIILDPSITKDSEERTIPMTERVRKILSRRLKLGRPFPFTRDKVDHAWSWAQSRMGIEEKEFTPHALRHTFASRLLAAGVDLYTVKNLLGHSSITTTERYSHLNHGHLAGAVAKL